MELVLLCKDNGGNSDWTLFSRSFNGFHSSL